MTARVEVWTRPGDGSFGRRIVDLPYLSLSGTIRRNGVGDGQVVLPDAYDRLDDIYQPPDGASFGGVASLLRVYDGTTRIAELVPQSVVPQQSKGDHVITVDCSGIEAVLGYGRLEVFDWDGSDNHTSLFPDWKFGAENKAPQLDGIGTAAQYQLFVADETYGLSVDATGGDYTLTVLSQTTSAIAYNASASAIASALEALSSVTTVDVTQFEDESYRIRILNPENVSPDMSITDSTTGGTGTDLTKTYDGFTKTGTTFTLDVDGDTTAPISWNSSAAGVEFELQALTTVAEVTVEGEGTIDEPWVITFYDPAEPGTFTADDTGLSGGTIELNEVQSGEDSFGGWTTSRYADQRIDIAVHGEVSTFQLVDDTIGGNPVTALEFVASSQFGGAQAVIQVTPGSTAQASVWVKSSSATARYRWVIRAVTDELDNCITGYPSCTGEFTLAANTWTQLTLTDIGIPDDVEGIIFRIAYVGTTEPQAGSMRIALPVYYEGLPPGTLGYILRTLYDDMVDDHGSGDPIYWDDGTGSPYLTLDFDDTNDSAGNAWADDELSMEFLHEQSFLQCLTSATAKGGTSGSYTWRVVADDPAAGTWLLQVFNPGTVAAWDLSGDDDCPVVRKGRDVTNRSYRRFMPQATDMAYEGGGYQIARRRNDAAVAALGRIGGYVPDPDTPDLATAGLAAEAELAMRLAGATSLAYQVTPDRANGAAVPLVDYLPGYTILVEDEPLIAQSAHVIDAVRFRFGKGADAYEVHFDTESFVGNEAVSEGVRRLLAVFKGIRPEAAAGITFGGNVIPWLVACSDAPTWIKKAAGYLCDGTADQEEINASLKTWGKAWLYTPADYGGGPPPATYYISDTVAVSPYQELAGFAITDHQSTPNTLPKIRLVSGFSSEYGVYSTGMVQNVRIENASATSTASQSLYYSAGRSHEVEVWVALDPSMTLNNACELQAPGIHERINIIPSDSGEAPTTFYGALIGPGARVRDLFSSIDVDAWAVYVQSSVFSYAHVSGLRMSAGRKVGIRGAVYITDSVIERLWSDAHGTAPVRLTMSDTKIESQLKLEQAEWAMIDRCTFEGGITGEAQVWLIDCADVRVDDCMLSIENSADGVFIDGGARCVVRSTTIETVNAAGTTNTRDHIRIDGGENHQVIDTIHNPKSSSPAPRYALNLVSGTRVLVDRNDWGDASLYGTGDFVDGGTGTRVGTNYSH